MSSSDTQPLSGITVIDFTQAMLGPVSTLVLADYGADVIKIERPGQGDLSRWSEDGDPDNPVYRSMNRNKRSIALDLRSAEGKEIIYDLARKADVVVNNFRAGVMDRMGFGYDALRKLNPGIIFASGTGFGADGPLSHKGGQDVLAQALSGVMARRPDPATPYSVYSTCLCDYTAGMHLAQAILLALLQRNRTGVGQRVSVSLFESMLAMQTQEAAVWLQERKELNWGAMPLTGAFATSDGALVLVGAFKSEPLRDICAALDLGEMWRDPRFETPLAQKANRSHLQSAFAERFAGNTTAYWIGRLEEQDLLCAPILTMEEALAHQQTVVNGTVVEVAGEQSLRAIGTPLRLENDAFRIRHVPPKLGADGEAVLADLGYSSARIAGLKQTGILS
ncbi:MAG: CoA transferase [Aquamicrobium sp.]|uniref:CaiB/BaiF CoA transferase family protein n=1 Tax=Aquamicrobium sp. TaxID=1872579 RepID=UPI00349EBD29|nr:CoA transferase [Aquamicrobium sp.]MCO5155512.1 CoA transferase [Aquamicrobium sp.]